MFIISLLIVGGVIGYLVGFSEGKTSLERSILRHVTESPGYESRLVDVFARAFKEEKK